MMAVAEPDEPGVENPLPVAVPSEHEYEIAIDMPTSATCGWHDICATGTPEPEPLHCQPVKHEPLYEGSHGPVVQFAGLGCAGGVGHCCDPPPPPLPPPPPPSAFMSPFKSCESPLGVPD